MNSKTQNPPTINKVYQLTDTDIEYITALANKRNNAKSENIRERHSTGMASNMTHTLGLCGEVAYAKVTGKTIDEQIYINHGDVDDFDGIEVKAATWKGPDIELKITEKEFSKKTPIAYVLVRVDLIKQTVEFIGSISRKRFTEIKYHKTHTVINNWCVQGSNLSPVVAVMKDSLELIPIK